jgi:hypothetical protein
MGAPQPTDDETANALETQVTDDVGGVQGASPEEEEGLTAAAGAPLGGSTAEEPAPDAGEIEWAGQLVKKPPTPGA